MLLTLVLNKQNMAQNTYPWPTTGNIGIGTTSPVRLLDLYGTGNWAGSGGIRLQGNNPGIEITDVPSGQRWLIGNGVTSANDGSLGLAYNFKTSRHNIVVTNTDNVGIGVLQPSAKLEIVNAGSASLRVGVTSNKANTYAQVLNSLAAIGNDNATI